MKQIYIDIWDAAKPYYEKGRKMDMDHIEWMMEETVRICDYEDLDDSILMPMVILHDIGYSQLDNENPFDLDLRTAHMEEGAKFARKILDRLQYPEEKTKQIVEMISIHDNWALGDNSVYQNNHLLAVFSDLDYIWIATQKGFPAFMDALHKSHEEILNYVEAGKNRTFSCNITKELYVNYLENREQEV